MQVPPETPHHAALSQDELLALALEASRRNDATQSLIHLEEVCRRPDATGMGLFMLGSEYAQLGLHAQAKTSMARAIELAEDFHLARFQLGMLHLTTGDGEAAVRVWLPLASLDSGHPQHYLCAFHRGLLHLMADAFDEAIQALTDGVALNQDNPPLNADIHRIIDAIEHLPGRQPARDAGPGAADPDRADAEDLAPVAEHLFISTYTQGDKPR